MQQVKEIYILNHSLWSLVQEAAHHDSGASTRFFELPAESLEVISQCKEQSFARLCSETLVFFSLKKHEAQLLQTTMMVNNVSDRRNGGIEAEFAQLWWLSLGRMAANDPVMSAQAFGISVPFAKQVAAMPMQHIRQFSVSKHIVFSLRFDPVLIKPILLSQNPPAHLLLKIHQQALSHAV